MGLRSFNRLRKKPFKRFSFNHKGGKLDISRKIANILTVSRKCHHSTKIL